MENEGETVNLSTSKSRNNEPTKSQTNLVEFDSSEDETRKTIQSDEEDYVPGFIPHAANINRQDFSSNACNICDKSFSSATHLKTHMRIHTGEKPFKCDKCRKTFSDRSNYLRHVKIHEDETSNDDVYETGFLPNNDLEYKEDTDTEKKFPCPVCGKRFNRPSRLQTHILIHTGEKPFKCDTCGRGFADKSNFQRHVRIHEGDISKKHTCETCNKSFRSPSELKTHEMVHTGIKPFSCDLCDASFTVRSGLRYHQKLHDENGVKTYSCDKCDGTFTTKSSLNCHKEIHLRDPNDKYIYCDVCKMKGFSPVWLRRHKKKCTGQKPTCEICGKQFERGNALAVHLRKHFGETYFCDNHTHPRQFNSRNAYSRHFNICMRIYPCDTCNLKFTSTDDLENHKLEFPKSNCVSKCEKCDLIFKNKDDFEVHEAAEHNRRYCTICNKKFARPANLKKHQETVHRDLNISDFMNEPEDDHDMALEQDESIDPQSEHSIDLIACDLCDESFTDLTEFNKHKAGHMENVDYVITEKETNEDENNDDIDPPDNEEQMAEVNDNDCSMDNKDEMIKT